MTICSYCHRNIDGLPHSCKYCRKIHCSRHLLPESHNCKGLERYKRRNQERWIRAVQPNNKRSIRQESVYTSKQNPFFRMLKLIFWKSFEWLGRRNHYPYNYERLFSVFLSSLFVLALSLFILYFSLADMNELNQTLIWFIPLGWVLIGLSIFLFFKWGYRCLLEIPNWFKRQRNWLKLIIILAIIIGGYNLYQDGFFSNISANVSNLGSNSGGAGTGFIDSIKKTFEVSPERKEECQEAFGYLNLLRNNYGKKSLDWDERAYNLSVARAKDMYNRGYFDHVTPEGTCAYTIKGSYGFKSFEDVAENIGAQMWEDGSYTKDINVREQVDGWMESRGHRYNLLYSTHKSGAIGCYYGVCVFLGVNTDGFGEGCNTGDEGLEFWQIAPNQPGEV